jgi:hypothetical protein
VPGGLPGTCPVSLLHCLWQTLPLFADCSNVSSVFAQRGVVQVLSGEHYVAFYAVDGVGFLCNSMEVSWTEDVSGSNAAVACRVCVVAGMAVCSQQ